MKADNCTGTVNVQGDASGRSKLIVQTLHTEKTEKNVFHIITMSNIVKSGAL